MKTYQIILLAVISSFFYACSESPSTTVDKVLSPLEMDMEKSNAKPFMAEKDASGFDWEVDKFADKKIIRYKIPGWDKLSLQQKKLVYYLNEAGLSGRDIMYDQNYRHNLKIRRGLEKIYTSYTGAKDTKGWEAFDTFMKEVWFANGVHHHYSTDKLMPKFSKEYFSMLMEKTGTSLNDEVLKVLFDENFDNKKVNLNPDKGLVKGSAVNFYDSDITEAEVDAYYKSITEKSDRPISYGLNSKLVRNASGELEEKVYKSGGMYGSAIDKIIFWLEKAVSVAENEKQGNALQLLVDYYRTGDLNTWDEYNIAWVGATEGDIDYINSFIEVYNDPKGYSGSYETVIEINDFDASARMSVVMDNVQWFEDNSPLMEEHKKKNVKGVTYKVVTVAGEAGDSSPSTPIGVNLPNANWIRAEHGSKSVSLGNIVAAYAESSGEGMLNEFAYTAEEVERGQKYGRVAAKLHTALHEVVGHASGQLEKGVGTPKETLKSYASTLEEGRADLVALYYLMDPKLVELGLMESLDVGKESYESYIRNGLMLQLRRLETGKEIEEAHMRNRQYISKWVYEKGKADKVITKEVKDGKTYFVVNDYLKLRTLFGDLLREIQRIKSQGDYEAGRALVEGYGVKVDPAVHREVLDRAAKLNSAPYGGFVNPILVAEKDGDGNITDVKVTHSKNFVEQMLHYSKTYNLLPDDN
ncbi:MAG: dipeptidyl-peptidase-3 [Patiriisocius sp.]|jgi:dipeptidyl-peptidase-3